ncbi:hypothetical protein [Paracoccus tibetensis]|uniref:Sulfotransferase family protein n=1 Tax=Paracoccus tibetensis TaxID=336292 RepID=A0A1G5CFL2_9RHOB|nr:hypothetical protein [Paracoccus tibetensis]SCY01078.1 hypothetical protein SAMN05660710_00540 [Paracoccus tibetensis]
MQLVFHVGVHGTDGDRMLKTLLNNRNWLLKNGTEVVTPNRHRGIIDEALASLDGGAASGEMEGIMLDAMLESDAPARVVMSTPTFMGAPGRVCGREGLYPQMAARVAALMRLFPSSETEFFLAIRNPATLLAEVLPQFAGGGYDELVQGCGPQDLRWREPIRQLVQAAGGRRVVIWCHEDVPLIWPEVVRLVGGMPADVPLAGSLLYMHELLGDLGIARLREAMAGQDQLTVARRRQIYAEVLALHALPGMLDQVIELPGWTQEIVDEVTRNYRADVAEIAVLPGVEFILP